MALVDVGKHIVEIYMLLPYVHDAVCRRQDEGLWCIFVWYTAGDQHHRIDGRDDRRTVGFLQNVLVSAKAMKNLETDKGRCNKRWLCKLPDF